VNQSVRIKPSWWHCLWCAPFLLIGTGLFVYLLFHGIKHATDALTQVVVPGSAELEMRPGTYTVFLEEQSVVNGRIYSTSEPVDGLVCHVASLQNGSAIEFRKPSENTTYTYFNRSGRSVLEFSIQHDGEYRFGCDYDKSARGPDVVVAVGTGVAEAITLTVMGALASGFGGFVAAVFVVVIVGLMREGHKSRLRRAGQMQA
jgi:hypothetical protein